MKDAPLRHRLEHLLYLTVRAPVRRLSHAAARRSGRALGDLAWLADRRHRAIALDNLALAFPDRPAAERRAVARACFRHFGSALTDTLSATRFDLEELCRRTTLDGWDRFEAARAAAAPRGVLLISAHLGLWEHAAHAVGTYAGPLHGVGRPLDNPWLDRELDAHRRRFGNRLVPKRRAARGILRALEAGQHAALLMDQRVPRADGGVEIPFFGRPALTTPLVARLSLRLGVPAVPTFGLPEPDGRYRIVFRDPIPPGAVEGATGDEAILALTRLYLEALESEIRRAPELWLWLHRRWRR